MYVWDTINRSIANCTTTLHWKWITDIDPASIIHNNLLVTRWKNSKTQTKRSNEMPKIQGSFQHLSNAYLFLLPFDRGIWPLNETKINPFQTLSAARSFYWFDCLVAVVACAVFFFVFRTFRFRRIDRSWGILRVWGAVSHLPWNPILRYSARRRCCTRTGNGSCSWSSVLEQRIGLPVAPMQRRERVPTGGLRKFRIE